MSNLTVPAAEWLQQQFEFEWCAECGRDHRHHTAVPFMGNWFARCDLEPLFTATGELIVDPEGYATTERGAKIVAGRTFADPIAYAYRTEGVEG